MGNVLRYVYRGSSSTYNVNYGGYLTGGNAAGVNPSVGGGGGGGGGGAGPLAGAGGYYPAGAPYEPVPYVSGDTSPPPPPAVTGGWFRYADGVTDGRIFGIGGFADTNNSVYGLGTDEQNAVYRYVVRVDADNATPIWNKRISFSDSGTYSLSAVPQCSLVDDENGTDGTLSLFVQKNGASFVRIYRVVINKADGSIANTIVSELNIPPSLDHNCIVRKVNDNYVVNFLPAQVPNPCGGRNFPLASLVASFTANMQINWVKVFGKGSKQNQGGGSIFTSIFPKFDNGVAHNRPYYFFGFDSEYIYMPNPEEGGSWAHGNNYIRLNIDTGAAIDGPTVWQTGAELTNTNAIHSRCAYAGSDGSIYTDGFTAGSVTGSSYLVKWDNDTPTWSRSYSFGGGQTTTGQKLLERNGKILLAHQIQYSTGFYDLRICLVDPSDGSVIANTGKLIYWDGGVTKDIGGSNINIIPMADSSGAIIITQTGWFVRIDVNNLPAAGIYPMSDVPGSNWIVDDITVTSSAFSLFTSATTSSSVGCSSFTIGSDPMPTLTNVSVTGTNPTVTATAEDNPTFSIDRIGGYYSVS
jgi:hypothetical protein